MLDGRIDQGDGDSLGCSCGLLTAGAGIPGLLSCMEVPWWLCTDLISWIDQMRDVARLVCLWHAEEPALAVITQSKMSWAQVVIVRMCCVPHSICW